MVLRRGINVPPSPPPPPSKKSMNEKKITSKPAAIQFFLLDSGSAEKIQFPHKHLLSLFLERATHAAKARQEKNEFNH